MGPRSQLLASLHIDSHNSRSKSLYIKMSDEWRTDERWSIQVPFPIPEGYSKKLEDGRRIEYSNGVLKSYYAVIENKTETLYESQEIWIDPKLKSPTKARYIIRGNGKTVSYFDIVF